MLEAHAIVLGDVQGVGFRASAKALAQALHITGFVRNLPDGSVEICAQGEKEAIDRFIEKLKQNYSSNLQEIQTTYRSLEKIYAEFVILR